MSGAVLTHNRVIRRPVNPYDRATIISIFPKDVKETKPTLFPSEFLIKAGTESEPSFTEISPASWFRETDENMPAVEIQVNAATLAESIVNDFALSFIKAVIGVAQPGLFWIPGKHTPKNISNYSDENGLTYSNLLGRAITLQRAWYVAMVQMADVDWSRTNGNPLSVSEWSKIAAKALGMAEKPWVKDFLAVSLYPCPACGTMGNPEFPKCGNCGYIINQAKAKELGLITGFETIGK